jgi:hypothetical protein
MAHRPTRRLSTAVHDDVPWATAVPVPTEASAGVAGPDASAGAVVTRRSVTVRRVPSSVGSSS